VNRRYDNGTLIASENLTRWAFCRRSTSDQLPLALLQLADVRFRFADRGCARPSYIINVHTRKHKSTTIGPWVSTKNATKLMHRKLFGKTRVYSDLSLTSVSTTLVSRRNATNRKLIGRRWNRTKSEFISKHHHEVSFW